MATNVKPAAAAASALSVSIIAPKTEAVTATKAQTKPKPYYYAVEENLGKDAHWLIQEIRNDSRALAPVLVGVERKLAPVLVNVEHKLMPAVYAAEKHAEELDKWFFESRPKIRYIVGALSGMFIGYASRPYL
jgi:hypothetical protein